MSSIHSLCRIALPALALVLVTSGCGKIPDPGAGGDDDAPDGAPPVGSAEVTVFHDDGTFVVGAVVVHTRADGTYVASVETGADGVAALNIIQGDIAHVGFDELQSGSGQVAKRLYTIDYLHVDDDIAINDQREGTTSTAIGSATVVVPGLPPGANKGELVVGNNNYGINGTTNDLGIFDTSVDDRGKLTIVGLARNDAGLIIATSLQTDLTPPAANGTITVTMPAWTPAAPNTSVMLTGIPAQARSVAVRFTSFRGGLEYQSEERNGLTNLPTQTLATTFPLGYVDTVQTFTIVDFAMAGNPTQADGTVFLVSKQAHSATAPYMATVDVSKSLPRLYQAQYDSVTNTFEWMTESASTEQTARLDAADLVVLGVNWRIGPTDPSNQWLVLAPGGRGSPVKYDLHEAAAFAPPADQQTIPAAVQVLEFDVIEDYQQIKNDFGTAFLEGGIDTLATFEAAASFSGAAN